MKGLQTLLRGKLYLTPATVQLTCCRHHIQAATGVITCTGLSQVGRVDKYLRVPFGFSLPEQEQEQQKLLDNLRISTLIIHSLFFPWLTHKHTLKVTQSQELGGICELRGIRWN